MDICLHLHIFSFCSSHPICSFPSSGEIRICLLIQLSPAFPTLSLIIFICVSLWLCFASLWSERKEGEEREGMWLWEWERQGGETEKRQEGSVGRRGGSHDSLGTWGLKINVGHSLTLGVSLSLPLSLSLPHTQSIENIQFLKVFGFSRCSLVLSTRVPVHRGYITHGTLPDIVAGVFVSIVSIYET